MNFVRVFVLALVAVAHLSADPLPNRFFTEKPKLVFFISVDQFRADYLTRFQKRFLPAGKLGAEVGGFQFLMTNGAYFPFAQYGILQDMTGPGHAIMSTGALPYQAGIPLNYWANADRSDMVYCAEDESQATVGVEKTKAHVGTSPKNLLATTVGDELKNAGYASRVISIALKDRAAIFMGGQRADLALWFDQENFKWVSSRYYLPKGKLPEWVNGLNEGFTSSKGQNAQWTASGTPVGTSFVNIPAGDAKVSSFGLNFPHPYKKGTADSLSTPLGLEMTADAVEKAVTEYKLGQGKATDYLAVSFSSHDYMGHQFGPNSLEAEEMTVADDKVIARLFNYLHKKVPGGLKNVLVVLTADHGIPPNPDWLRSQRMSAGRVDEEKLQQVLEQKVSEKLGRAGDQPWIAKLREFNIYLNPKALEKKDISRSSVEEAVKRAVLQETWVNTVFGSVDVKNQTLPGNLLGAQIKKTYYFGRSGDVIIIPKPYFMPGKDTVTHMTGYSYDRTVPLLFAGPHVKASVYATPADIIDIAPTLSFILGVLPPNMAEGRVLEEILH